MHGVQLPMGEDSGGGFVVDPHEALARVYPALRALAQSMLDRLSGHSIQGTDLVHEAMLKLGPRTSYESDRHFWNAMAMAMRHALTDRRRVHDALKRGGTAKRLPLDDHIPLAPKGSPDEDDKLAVLEALESLAEVLPEAAEVVRLWLTGLDHATIAHHTRHPPAFIDALFREARAYLRVVLREHNVA